MLKHSSWRSLQPVPPVPAQLYLVGHGAPLIVHISISDSNFCQCQVVHTSKSYGALIEEQGPQVVILNQDPLSPKLIGSPNCSSFFIAVKSQLSRGNMGMADRGWLIHTSGWLLEACTFQSTGAIDVNGAPATFGPHKLQQLVLRLGKRCQLPLIKLPWWSQEVVRGQAFACVCLRIGSPKSQGLSSFPLQNRYGTYTYSTPFLDYLHPASTAKLWFWFQFWVLVTFGNLTLGRIGIFVQWRFSQDAPESPLRQWFGSCLAKDHLARGGQWQVCLNI